MKSLKILALASAIAALAIVAVPRAQSQISVRIGAEPNCPYGYYDYAPYRCAPYGYFGPEWFNGGVFIGSGKWFHGDHQFHGKVDNHFDRRHGYKGPTPHVGDKAEHEERAPKEFKGNEDRDGRGHANKPR